MNTAPKRLSKPELADALEHAEVRSEIWPHLLAQHIAALEAELAEARAVSNQRRELLAFYAVRPDTPFYAVRPDAPWICLLCEVKADTAGVVHQPQCPAAPEEP